MVSVGGRIVACRGRPHIAEQSDRTRTCTLDRTVHLPKPAPPSLVWQILRPGRSFGVWERQCLRHRQIMHYERGVVLVVHQALWRVRSRNAACIGSEDDFRGRDAMQLGLAMGKEREETRTGQC